MFEPLIVNRKKHVSFSKIFEEKHGLFKPSSQNSMSLKIKTFTIDDIELIRCPQDIMSGDDFAEDIVSRGYIPLDLFHARAIKTDGVALSRLTSLTSKYIWVKRFSLETISFFGTKVTDGQKEHVVCLKFDSFLQNGNGPIFMCFEGHDTGWSEFHDLAAVFKKSSVEKLLKNGK